MLPLVPNVLLWRPWAIRGCGTGAPVAHGLENSAFHLTSGGESHFLVHMDMG